MAFSFKIDWYYYLVDRINGPSRGRGGYEYFPKDDQVQEFAQMVAKSANLSR